MGLWGKIAGVGLVGGIGYGIYSGYDYWNRIKIYPPDVRNSLRSALRAERDGRSGDAENSYHEALTVCTKLEGSKSKACQSILLKMAQFYEYRSRPDRASKIYESILEAGGEWIDEDRRIEIMKSMADCIDQQGNHGKAIEIYEDIMKMLKSSDTRMKNDAEVMSAILNNMGNSYFANDSTDLAIKCYENAIEPSISAFGKYSFEYFLLLNNLASTHYTQASSHQSASDKAIAFANEALEILGKVRKFKEHAEDADQVTKNLKLILDRLNNK